MSRTPKLSRRSLAGQDGFTLIEVLVITPIMMVTAVSILAFLFTMYGQFVQKNEEAGMQAEHQAAMLVFKDDLLYATSFGSTTTSYINDPYAPSGGWSNATSPPTLIVVSPNMTASWRDTNRQQVYIDPGTGCADPNQVKNYSRAYNNFIYFVSGGTLYKRLLVTSGVATCGTGFYVQSCPAANSTPACPTDRVLATDVSTFSVTYLRPDNQVTTTPELAERVQINLTSQKTVAGQSLDSSSSITLKRLGE